MTDTAGGRAVGVVALGASAGGIDALRRTVGALPRELPPARCAVLHIPATPHGLLATILGRATALPVCTARSARPPNAASAHLAAREREPA